MTPAEKILWYQIKANKLGVNFKRQEAFIFGEYRYIADFFCHKHKLVIEIDGGYHDDEEMKTIDSFRDDIFKEAGYNVIRFTNQEVSENLEEVIVKIKKFIN